MGDNGEGSHDLPSFPREPPRCGQIPKQADLLLVIDLYVCSPTRKPLN